jgi:hypothetical protein
MADVYAPRACTEREALDLLAAEAERGDGRLGKARLDFDTSVLRRVTLWLPDVVGQTELPASAVGLDVGLPRLLVNRAREATRVAELSHERLFITSRLEPDAVVRTLRKLEGFATPARVARLRSEGGADVWLVHVLVDPHRQSGFSGLEKLGLFRDWDGLACYSIDASRVFLTAGVLLPRDLLDPLSRLLAQDETIALLGLHPQGPRDERFYILNRTDDPGTYETLALPAHAFVDSTEVGFALDASVTLTKLESADPTLDLLKDLGGRAPSRGYRLRLETTRAGDRAPRELEQLWSQQAYLSQRIAYAESLRRPKPHLLRFTQHQLGALAHMVYSFDPVSLFDSRPRVLYAFQASSREPAGFHYLLIEPDAVRRSPDPSPLYVNAPAMKFWLDPSWGRYHEEAGANGYVFVPEHTALVPSLHAWMPADMDEHLRRVFARPWLAANGAEDQRGASYVYVLDQAPEAGRLELTVIERASFKHLGTSVRWLSDNLTIADRQDVAALLVHAAEAVRRDVLTDAAAGETPASLKEFRREAANARARFIKDLDAVVSSVNRSTFDVLQRAHLAIDAMKELDREMDGLADIRERSQGVASVRELLNGIDTLTTLLTDRLGALEKHVSSALRQADALAEDERRKVDDLLLSLEAKRANLRDRLQ